MGERGTTVYLRHPQLSSWTEQIGVIQGVLEEYGLVLDRCWVRGDIDEGVMEKEDLSDVNFSKLRELTLRYLNPNTTDVHAVVFSYRVSTPETEGYDDIDVWRMSTDIDLYPSLAMDAIFVESPKYTYGDVLDFYNLVKKIFVDVGFDLAAGCQNTAYFPFGYEGDDGYDEEVLRFDTKGRCSLIIPYEERREMISKDAGVRSDWLKDYSEPVPINYTFTKGG